MRSSRELDHGRFVRRILAGTSFVAVDIGARGGTPLNWKGFQGSAHLICVDGDKAACDALQHELKNIGIGDRYTIINATLTKAGGPRTLYTTNVKSASSLFDPDQPLTRAYVDESHIFPVETRTIPTQPAAEAFRRAGIGRIDLIKLDIQGCELEVLEALMDAGLLNRTSCIETETAWQDKGLGYPQFLDVHAFLKRNGFDLFDVQPVRAHRTLDGSRATFQIDVFGVHRSSPSVSPRLREANALYFRDDSVVLQTGGTEDLRRLMVSYGVYRFFSEGYYLATQAAANGTISQKDLASLQDALVDWHRATRYRWRYGPGRFAAQARWWLHKWGLRESSSW